MAFFEFFRASLKRKKKLIFVYEVGFTKKFQNFSKTIIRPNCAIFDARDVRNELYSSLYLAQMTVTFVLVRLAKFRAI